MTAYRIYVEDEDTEKVILSVLVTVEESENNIEPVATGIATDISIKRALVAAAGIALGEEWWKEDNSDE